jgi:tetratricopeptide (TPR) repeat protein
MKGSAPPQKIKCIISNIANSIGILYIGGNSEAEPGLPPLVLTPSQLSEPKVNCPNYIPKPIFYLTFLILVLCGLPCLVEAADIAPVNFHKGRPNPDIIQGINNLYDLEFDEAERHFNKFVSERPEHPAGYFYRAMVPWSRLSVGFWTAQNLQEYIERIDQTISVARTAINRNEKDSRAYFYLGGALGFKGRFELMQQNWFSSYNLAYDAIQALKTCQKLDPDNKDVLLGLGIYDYYTARLSGVLKFLTYLFLHKGNKEEGLRKLHMAANEAVYSGLEAKSMLIHIYLYLEEDFSKALPLIKDLRTEFTKNMRYRFFEGLVYIRQDRDAEYRRIVDLLRAESLKKTTKADSLIWENEALYLEATYYLFRGEPQLARDKLDAILSQADPALDPDMIAFPILKKGMSYDLEGKREKALEYYHQVLKMDNGAGAQFLAQKCVDEAPKKGDPFLGY